MSCRAINDVCDGDDDDDNNNNNLRYCPYLPESTNTKCLIWCRETNSEHMHQLCVEFRVLIH
jgi:hypothetical protein